jgi:hypothetical protein
MRVRSRHALACIIAKVKDTYPRGQRHNGVDRGGALFFFSYDLPLSPACFPAIMRMITFDRRAARHAEDRGVNEAKNRGTRSLATPTRRHT